MDLFGQTTQPVNQAITPALQQLLSLIPKHQQTSQTSMPNMQSSLQPQAQSQSSGGALQEYLKGQLGNLLGGASNPDIPNSGTNSFQQGVGFQVAPQGAYGPFNQTSSILSFLNGS